MAPVVYEARSIIRNIGSSLLVPAGPPPPPPPTIGQMVEEIEALVDGFVSELFRSTTLLIDFFTLIPPQSAPWITELVKKNPGNIRSTLGEALCIWWLQRVLSQSNHAWVNTKGPEKWADVEVDAISSNDSGVSVAEIKISTLI